MQGDVELKGHDLREEEICSFVISCGEMYGTVLMRFHVAC